MINFNFITSRYGRYSNVHKLCGVLVAGSSTCLLLYSSYFHIKEKQKIWKLRTEKRETIKNNLEVSLAIYADICLPFPHRLTLNIDPTNKKQQAIFDKLVDLYDNRRFNVDQITNHELYIAFKDIFDKLNHGEGIKYQFEISNIRIDSVILIDIEAIAREPISDKTYLRCLIDNFKLPNLASIFSFS